MATTTRPVSADELMRLPDDGMRHELIEGELRTMTPVGAVAAVITVRLAASLHAIVSAHRLGLVLSGEPGFFLAENPDTVRAPDVAFVRRERAREVGRQTGYFPGPPDLAIEVISPNDLYTD